MTVATGDKALAVDVVSVQAVATSALTAAGVAVSNAASALTEAEAARAVADAAAALAAVALSVPGLGVVTSVNGSDKVLIGQGSNTVAITVTNLHATLTTAIAAAAALGTAASSQAATAAATAATALTNAANALAAAQAAAVTAGNAFWIPGLTVVTSVGSSDTIPIGQSGSTVAVSVGTLLDAETIDVLSPAGSASDSDTLLVGQGTNVLTRQTLAALWAWVTTHIPGYKVPILEVTTSLTIDATYNGRILVVTAPNVTLSPNFSLMGSGFVCDIITAGAGTVLWGPAVTATNGATGLSIGSHARLMAFVCSTGNVVVASVGDQSGGVAQAAPGTITGLTGGATTSTTLAFSWTAPSTGGTASYFAVQYRVTGAGAWTAGPNTSSTNTTLSGLASSTSYDVQVAAGNSGGVSAWSGTVASSTAAPSVAAPGTPTGLAVGTTTTTAVSLTWTAPSTGGPVSTYTMQYRQTSLGGAWTQVTGIGTSATTVSGLTASTGYDFQVAAVGAGGSSGFTATTAGSTATPSSTTAAWNTYPTTAAQGSTGVIFNFSIAGGTAPTTAAIGFSTSQTIPPNPMPSVADGLSGNFNGNYWGTYAHAPGVTGNVWYGWAMGWNAVGTPLFTIVGPPITIT